MLARLDEYRSEDGMDETATGAQAKPADSPD